MTKEQEYGLPKGWEIVSRDDCGYPKRMYCRDLHMKVFRFGYLDGSSGWAWNVSLHGSDICGDVENPPPEYRQICLRAMLEYGSLMYSQYTRANDFYNQMVEND